MSDQNDGIEQDRIYKSEDVVKDAWQRVKLFVNEHPTVSASVVTGVISWKISKRHTLKKVTGEVTALAYQWGNEAGVLELQNTVLLDFINEKNLGDEVREFIREHVTVETV